MRVWFVILAALLASCGKPPEPQNAGPGTRVPSFNYIRSSACGGPLDDHPSMFYAISGNGIEFLVVQGIGEAHGRATETFDAARLPANLSLKIDVFSSPPPEPYCSDVAHVGQGMPESWAATSGRLSVSHGGIDPTIILEDCVFMDRLGRTARQKAPIWIAGGGAGTLLRSRKMP